MRAFRPIVLVAATTTGLLTWVHPVAAKSTATDDTGGLPAAAVAQIDQLAAAKRARTPVQRKVDSVLLAESQLRRGASPAPGVSHLSTGVKVDRGGLTTVDVHGRVDAAMLDRIQALGGRVRHSFPRQGTVRADVPLAALTTLAAAGAVRRISVAATAIHASAGAAASEGDATHAADTARARFKVSGIGVTVAVLSDGVDSLTESAASGDLPSEVTVLPDQAGVGDEGTAMLEIVHDLAPKAKLMFATSNDGIESFAQNIRDVRAAGADIIVDDTLYFGESPFQDGPIASAVADVTAHGALYFSSAGNEGNVDAGTAGNYEGDFVPSGHGIGKLAGVAHDFDPGAGVQFVDPVTAGSATAPAILQWADPLGAATDDYDLYALDPAGNVVAFSNDVQDGDDDPFEGFFLPSASIPYRLAVVKFSGADRYFQLSVLRGRFGAAGDLRAFATPGMTRGHSAVPAAFSVAAAPAHDPLPFDLEPGDPPNPSGPFPGVFTTASRAERFTSDGPRRMFFHPDGSPLTPGNLSSTGGELRQKPDLTAADGVHTSLADFDPFFGTSAAAPHAAAIAALVVSGNPGITAEEVRAALTGTALDLEAAGADRDTGAGAVRADLMLRSTGATPQPYAVPAAAVVSSSTDGDAFLEPGETGQLTVPVTNIGDGAATKVSVALRSSTAGVTISPAVRSYGRLAAGQTAAGRPFAVSVPATMPVGTVLRFTAKVSFVGAFSPQQADTRLLVGQPSEQFVETAFGGAPVPIPDDDEAGAAVSLPVSGVGPVSRVTFSVDGTACTTDPGATTVGIDHTFVDDLVGTLSAPDGTSVTLFDRVGGSGGNICQAVFDDAAQRSIQTAAQTDAPFTGRWQPAQPLLGLAGHGGDGTWTFQVADRAGADTGSIRAVTLRVAGFAESAS